MEMDKEIKNRLLKIDWLCNCGSIDILHLQNDYIYIKKTKEIETSLDNYKWENVGLKASGDFTEYLSLNYPKEDRYWNQLVAEAKEEIIVNISQSIIDKCNELEVLPEMVDYINWDIVTIAVIYSYKRYHESDFYNDMLKIYEAGHLPCGWIGRYPKGKFKIF